MFVFFCILVMAAAMVMLVSTWMGRLTTATLSCVAMWISFVGIVATVLLSQ